MTVAWIEEPSALGAVDLSRGVSLIGDSLAVGLTGPLRGRGSVLPVRAGEAPVTVAWIEEPSALGAVDLSRGVSLIGDSLAVGLTGPLSQELADYHFSAASKGGTDIRAWLQGAQASSLNQILAGKPALVLVSLGTNDTAPASQPNAATIRERVLELVKRVRQAGAQPVWLLPGTLPWSTEALLAAVKESGASTIAQPAETDKTKKYDPSHVHPTGEGYKTWAATIAKSLKSAPSTGVSRGGGLLGGALIIAAAVGLLWATMRVGRGAGLLENRSLPSWYTRPKYVHHIPSGASSSAEEWRGWTVFKRCAYSYSYFFQASTLDEIEARIRRGLPRLPRDCWYAVAPTDRDYTSH